MIRTAITVSTCVVLLVACADEAGTSASDGTRNAPIAVTLREVQLSPLRDSLQAIGTSKARESVALTAKVTEIVDAIHFESGDEVKAGQILVTLRDEGQRAALAQAEAQAREAERLYQRSSELAARHLVPLSELDQQLSARDVARAHVLQMRAAVADRVVRAPFAGKLGIRQVSAGALVTPTTVVVTLDDISRVFVDFHLPETQMGFVEIGDRVTARSAARPGREFAGHVSTLDLRVDPQTRSVLVRAEFPNSDLQLRPGMLMEVRLFGAERQALLVPEIAVSQSGSDSYVFRLDQADTVVQTSVKTGMRTSGEVEIIEGLEAGDRIVVEGVAKVRTGSRVVEAQARAAAMPAS